MSKVGILGYGEIGKGIADCIADSVPSGYVVKIHDPEEGFQADLSDCEFVHVCVPNNALMYAMGEHKWGEVQDQAVIIHTTTEVGNCQIVADHFKQCGIHLYHAPVRGKHPHLAASLQTFDMFISGPGHTFGPVEQYLESIDIFTHYVGDDYKVTELAKLMSTLRLAWDVMWRKHMEAVCGKFGVPPELVHDAWTESYNRGYKMLGDDHFVRPVLSFVPGPIGGHCVIPNAELLSEHSEVAEWILSLNRKLESSAPPAVAPTQISVE